MRFEDRKFVKIHPEHGIIEYINTGWGCRINKDTMEGGHNKHERVSREISICLNEKRSSQITQPNSL
jgi:hypothetical protein